MQAESRWVQTGWGIAEVRFLDPQQGGAILALLALAVVAAFVAHQEHSNEQDPKDRERVEKDEIEERVIGAHHRLQGRDWGGVRKRESYSDGYTDAQEYVFAPQHK